MALPPSQTLPWKGLLGVAVMGGLLGFYIGTSDWILGVILTVGVLAMALPIFRPVESLYLLFFMLTLTTDSASGLEGDFFRITDLDLFAGLPAAGTTYFLFISLVVLFRLILVERKQLLISPKYFYLYAAIVAMGMLTSLMRRNDPVLTRVDFMCALFPVICFYLCVQLLNSEERIRTMLAVILGASFIKAMALLIFYAHGKGWPYSAETVGAFKVATMDSADLLVFITLILVVLSLWINKRLQGMRLLAAGLSILPLLLVVVFAYRRTQWVGMAASLGLMMLWAPRPGKIRLAAIGLAVILWTVCAVILLGVGDEHLARFSHRTLSIVDASEDSNQYHLMESLRVLKDIYYFPITGLGLGSHHSPLGLYEGDTVPTNIVHNTWLYIWMKIGLPGLLFFLWASYVYFRRILRHRPFENQPLLLGLASSAGLWLAMSLTSPTPWYQHQTYLIALFAAMAFTLTQTEGETTAPRKESNRP